ncbi:4-hydroxybenzoate transporter [Klebsiella pneumoniae subsp. pneumoniae KpQ3]|nr:4-hydroxybenzoate transporter [Klebsiella pneumoniae subsp. pneumoniae KpQ3]
MRREACRKPNPISRRPAPALPLFSYPFTKIFEATSSR